ncbi:hypothetical protein MTR_3g105975 [Medicago truncatula]|uniref:Uncharacterized protein n=1 Tax=Medicago truncatula TaxID=3880 RepID=A0A072V1N2_MEDTR|nr:hypothetical protein MTR_3g105975 [Medicago truncatula]
MTLHFNNIKHIPTYSRVNKHIPLFSLIELPMYSQCLSSCKLRLCLRVLRGRKGKAKEEKGRKGREGRKERKPSPCLGVKKPIRKEDGELML